MKWIGQHIYDQISRFRGDVYFEAGVNFNTDTVTFTSANADDPVVIIENTAVDSQAARLQFKKHRGVDAVDGDNIGEIEFWGYDDGTPSTQLYAKMYVEVNDATSGEESGLFGILIANHDGGTQTGFSLTGGSQNNEIDATIGHGAASVTTVEGTLTMGSTATINNSGVVQVAAQTVIDHDQLANFAANEHYTQANITTVGTIGTGVWNATAIASAKMATASASAQGAVELATTAEADSGTDTARAITAAGLKSHVDARYARSVISFQGQASMLSSGNWVATGQNGISNHTWNQDMGVNTEANTETTGSLAKQYGHMGIRMSYACTIENIYCTIRNASGNRQSTVGLFCARAADDTGGSGLPVAWGTNTATEPILQIHADANNESGSHANRPAHAEASVDVAMAAGDVFYPAIKLTGVTSGGNTDTVLASFTVGIKTLIA